MSIVSCKAHSNHQADSVCTAVAGHSQAYIAAVQGLQQQLAAFAAPAPANPKAALEQEVAALQQELVRAVSNMKPFAGRNQTKDFL